MRTRPISTRTAFIIVSLVTLVLIIGSAILSRIVFKAATAVSTVYFSQSTLSAPPGSEVKIDILADVSAPTNFVGAQFSLRYDDKQLEFAGLDPAGDWQAASFNHSSGRVQLALTPKIQTSLAVGSTRPINFGTIQFKTLVEGNSSLSFDPISTILVATGSSSGRTVENILASVQDAQIIVSTNARAASLENSQVRVDAAADSSQAMRFDSQRIIGAEPLVLPTSAVLMVQLQHQARVSVRFGPTPELGSVVNYTTVTDQAAVKINGLDSSKRYYYQVVAASTDSTNQTLGQLKSFQTLVFSDQTKIDRADFTIFPAKTNTSTAVFAVFYDSTGRIISGLKPDLTLGGGQFKAGPLSEVSGLYQTTVNSLVANRQILRADLASDGQIYSSQEALFDPTAVTQTQNSPAILSAINVDQKTINLIIVLMATLLVTGVGFYKLARAR